MTYYEKHPLCKDSSKNAHSGQVFFFFSPICFVFHFLALLFGH